MAKSIEDRLLLLCARQDFTAGHQGAVAALCRVSVPDWEKVQGLAVRHGIAPLVGHNLQACKGLPVPIPLAVLEKFRLATYRTSIKKEAMANKLVDLLRYLAGRGIPAMLIKGAALDLQVYRQPWYTVSGDLDLVLQTEPGSITDAEIGDVVGKLPGIYLEWECYAHHDVTLNGALPVDFSRIWADAQAINYRGQPACVMAPPDMLIAVCINACRQRFWRLKSLCDVAETLAHYVDVDWTEVGRRARADDCAPIVYAALLVTEEELAPPLPKKALAALQVAPPRAAIIRLLARRAASVSHARLDAEGHLLGRQVSAGLLLAYAASQPYQIWRRARYAWATRKADGGNLRRRW